MAMKLNIDGHGGPPGLVSTASLVGSGALDNPQISGTFFDFGGITDQWGPSIVNPWGMTTPLLGTPSAIYNPSNFLTSILGNPGAGTSGGAATPAPNSSFLLLIVAAIAVILFWK